MPITARSAPNNGRVKEAKVSSCTRGTGKALNGKAKRGDKMDIDRRTNGDKRGDIDKATIGKVKKGNNKDKNIGRGENKSKNVEGMVRKRGWIGKYSQTNILILILFSILIYILILIITPIFFIISIYTYSRKLSTRTSSIKHHIISFIFSPHGMSHISIEIWRKGRGDI